MRSTTDPFKIVLTEVSEDRYESDTGHTFARETGTFTPNGNPVAGRWVYRSPSGTFLDVDQYRYDLEARQNVKLVNTIGV
jgi:hypothetical protein